MRILRFLFTGAFSLAVNLGVYRLLYGLGVPYLAGSILAFLCGLCVGFVLQKFWTFKDRAHGRAHTQFFLYALVALVNLMINTAIVYILKGFFGVHYLLAQTVGAGVVALTSYLIYNLYIFADKPADGEVQPL